MTRIVHKTALKKNLVSGNSFTGKERDTETGYSYFGARYYDSDLSGLFLSVDPMSDRYLSLSPYAYCAWNPLKLVDPSGEIPISPLWLMIKGIARGVERFSSNPDVKTVAYSVNNPFIAIRIGSAVDGGTNGISSISSNFAINMTKVANLSIDGEGSQRNAIRHTLWQALITKEFGEKQAKRIGNAHEGVINSNLSKRNFERLSEADQVVDLLNNEIGRNIGKFNQRSSNVNMAEKVAAEFRENGLWTVVKNDDNTFSIHKTKISQGQYDKIINQIKTLNDYGLSE